ncbi:helicase-related protein [Nodularia sphaerocarpa]|uniref:helicase-related protein n=1 Tax=Nodularia sphaerocarpa TaxID=137816 RepID=UPI002330A4E0|nr:helicase-related protein [Nodularia sphaerocarpa]MDB9372337.1 phospholipase D-like domain-containing protein [Nodularia sphaerocarpa CS-585]MDB9377953.1 phospholipase D-like domain-containing protein [Nodularia sphaerocarpa CS-585A2]
MPRIFDNINEPLLDALQETIKVSNRSDFCVGYFNLRGWQQIDTLIEHYEGDEGACCRLLVGMQKLPKDELYKTLALGASKKPIDNQEVTRLRKRVAQEFRQQLMMGIPNNADEKGLQRLKQQLISKKLIVKLYLRHTLHAKLYIVPQNHYNLPFIGFLGSSNLTFSGLSRQGELNIDVTDHDATKKLQDWFNDRWEDKFSLDISQELAEIIDESWAREESIPPYYIYLKMAYHLSQEARDGLSQYQAPSDFKLFKFQEAAVRIAAHLVNKRGGVMVGDVVGLGKTLVGTAIAKICEEDFGVSTLIICPKNLVNMWQGYIDEYGLRGKVLSLSQVIKKLPDIPARFRLVLIDESHNLRNRDGQRYAAIKQYIEESGSRCILLSATPYNKTYLDLSAQLRLFIPESKDIGIKPEALIRELGNESEFKRRHSQTPVRSLAAFEKSINPEDWQQLMSRFMVRRTRSFIKDNYAKTDSQTGRKYLEFPDGTRSYFPNRIPKTAKFAIGSAASDPYAKLYSDDVVQIINSLNLPRYGLGNYAIAEPQEKPTPEEQRILDGLSRAGRRLMGFCRTNLFKRLESSGVAFIQSLERHILRNYVYLHAIEQGEDIPIGTQDADLLDTVNNDEDIDSIASLNIDLDNDDDSELTPIEPFPEKETDYKQKAAAVYQLYKNQYSKRFKWLRPNLFKEKLYCDLITDSQQLINILNLCGKWDAQQDQKLTALLQLIEKDYPDEKILIFTQFADTAYYLGDVLSNKNIPKSASVTGSSLDPTAFAYRFSPKSNNKNIPAEKELRVLIATDVLSEGQNLQDCRIIVNYDLPWAIIRLIQRAGRVDRIGQKAENILCYSFLPADGVEQLINLRGRLQRRLQENAEVVGTDESFFEGISDQTIVDLYHEKSGILDEEDDGEVDLTSEALAIWQKAIDTDPSLKKTIEQMPNVVYSTLRHQPDEHNPEGVLMYLRTADGTDALAWVNKEGKSVTQSQMRILRMAKCNKDTPAIERYSEHHNLVNRGSNLIIEQQKSSGGQLGSPRSARSKTYERLNHYIQKVEKETPLLALTQDWPTLLKAVEEIYRYPLRETAMTRLNRQLKSGITDEQLAAMVVSLRDNDALCIIHPEDEIREAQIICSLGLFQGV